MSWVPAVDRGRNDVIKTKILAKGSGRVPRRSVHRSEASGRHRAPARPVRSVAGRPLLGGVGGIPVGVQKVSRDRGYDLSRGSDLRPLPLALDPRG